MARSRQNTLSRPVDGEAAEIHIDEEGNIHVSPVAGKAVFVDLTYVVEFNAAKANHINCGRLFPHAAAYDNDFWLAVKCKPEADNHGRYMFATSRTGNHVVMFGFIGGSPGYLIPVAYHNANHVSVGSDIEVKAGEWHEFALGLQGCTVPGNGTYFLYIDGVPVGSKAKTTSRTGNGNEQTLFIGGNEHSTLNGRIAQAALYEGATAFPFLYGDQSYTPPPEFRTVYEGSSGVMKAAFLIDLTKRSLADLSDGFNGVRHSGQFDNGADDGQFIRNLAVYGRRVIGNQPTWIAEAVSLSAHDGTAIPSRESGAIHQDSFTRANKTLEDGRSLGLGALEFGGQTWNDGGYWGIIENTAFGNFAGGGSGHAYIDAGQTTYSIEVTPVPTAAAYGSSAGIVFRRQDANNYYRIYFNGGDGYAYLYRIIGGVESLIAVSSSTVLVNGWTKIKISLDGSGNVVVRRDGSSTVLHTFASLPSFAAATGVGMWTSSSLRKISKFVVFDT